MRSNCSVIPYGGDYFFRHLCLFKIIRGKVNAEKVRWLIIMTIWNSRLKFAMSRAAVLLWCFCCVALFIVQFATHQ